MGRKIDSDELESHGLQSLASARRSLAASVRAGEAGDWPTSNGELIIALRMAVQAEALLNVAGDEDGDNVEWEEAELLVDTLTGALSELVSIDPGPTRDEMKAYYDKRAQRRRMSVIKGGKDENPRRKRAERRPKVSARSAIAKYLRGL